MQQPEQHPPRDGATCVHRGKIDSHRKRFPHTERESQCEAEQRCSPSKDSDSISLKPTFPKSKNRPPRTKTQQGAAYDQEGKMMVLGDKKAPHETELPSDDRSGDTENRNKKAWRRNGREVHVILAHSHVFLFLEILPSK
jgi:hypothetical protein